jgi:hypothetical protein
VALRERVASREFPSDVLSRRRVLLSFHFALIENAHTVSEARKEYLGTKTKTDSAKEATKSAEQRNQNQKRFLTLEIISQVLCESDRRCSTTFFDKQLRRSELPDSAQKRHKELIAKWIDLNHRSELKVINGNEFVSAITS